MDNKNLLDKLLQGEITPREREQLVDWFSQGDARLELDEVYQKAWDKSSPLIDNARKERMWDNVLMRTGVERRRQNAAQPKPAGTRRILRIAAGIAACAMIAVTAVFYTRLSNNSEYVVSVDRGQKASVTLPDGSEVTLNSGSTLRYAKNFDLRRREVKLSGEAYFDVSKNGKPFTVHTDDVDVNVLGTCFNVKAYDDDETVTASVAEGKVEVDNRQGEVETLLPSDEVTYYPRNREMVRSQIDVNEVALWSRNQIAFRDETLGEIAKRLSRMYNIDFVFADEGVKSYRFNGTIKNTSLQNVIETLILTAPVAFNENGAIVIISEDKQRKTMFE